MDRLTRPLVVIGGTRVSPLTLAFFLILVILVVAAARLVGGVVGSRLLARTAMDEGSSRRSAA